MACPGLTDASVSWKSQFDRWQKVVAHNIVVIDKKCECRQCPSVNGDWGRVWIKHWDNRTSQHQATSSKCYSCFNCFGPNFGPKTYYEYSNFSWCCNNSSTKTNLFGIVLSNSSSLYPLCSNKVEHWMEFLTIKCNSPLHHLVDQENRRSILPEKREGQ